MRGSNKKRLLFFLPFAIALMCWSCDPGKEGLDGISEEIEMINQNCPKMLDAETRIDRVEFRRPDTIAYYFTLVNLNAASLDTAAFRVAMWPGLIGRIKVSPELRLMRDNNAVFIYHYSDKSEKPAYIFTIAPVHYK
jgi:hypothetical protein